MSDKVSRAQLFRQKHASNEQVTVTTSDGLEWIMKKPSSKFFFDLFIQKDVSIGALNVDTGEEMKPEQVMDQAKKIIPVYELMKGALLKFSISPKILDSGVEPQGDDEISLDEFPSFEYMTELFNKLVEASGVPVSQTKDHESFRQ